MVFLYPAFERRPKGTSLVGGVVEGTDPCGGGTMNDTSARQIEGATGRRVYEYVDDDGVVYYSFTKQVVSLRGLTRLRLQSRVGTHITNFVTKLRILASSIVDEDSGG